MRKPAWALMYVVICLALATTADARSTSRHTAALRARSNAAAGAAVAGRPLWPGDVAVSTAPGDQGISGLVAPGVVAVPDGAGGAILVWEDDGSGWIHAQRLGQDGTAQWAAGGVAVAPIATYQSAPRAVADGQGGVIIAWIDDRNGICGPGTYANCNVIVQHLNGAGQPQWAAGGVAVSPVDAAHSASGISNEGTSGIGLASDGLGGAVIAWEDSRGTCCVFYAQRVDVNGTPSWGAEGIQISPNPTHVLGPVGVGPTVIGDSAGGALIGWLDVQVDPTTQSPSIVFQHFDVNGQATFSGPIAALQPSNLQYSVVDDGAGGAIIAAQVITAGGDGLSDVGAQRITVTGELPWGANGVPVAVAPNVQMQVQAAPDGAGGVLITWIDFRAPPDQFSADIYAQRINASGAPVWAINGVQLTAGLGGQRLPLVVSDGAGGAIVEWQDCRNLITPVQQYTCDFGRDLYAQRVSAAGQTMWPANGVAVTTAPFNQGVDYGSQNVPSGAVVSDTAGGAILAWPDGRAMPCPITVGARECDVYAQRISDQAGPGAVADLAVTLTASPSPPIAGSPVTFTVGIQNLGPNTAQSVNLTNFTATASLFSSLSPSQGACVFDSLCSLGPLRSGATATVTYVVTALQGGRVTDSVQVYAAETDPNPANNAATTGGSIVADFTLQATPVSQTVASGDTASYALTATATGGGSFGSGAPVSFACGTLPANSACAFVPGTSNGATSAATLKLSTGVAALSAAATQRGAALAAAFLLVAVAGSPRRRRKATGQGALALAALLALVSCGGGGGSSGTGTKPVTPSGTYTIMVTATNSGVSHSLPVTLVVQ